MAVQNEPARDYGVVDSPANGDRSYEEMTLENGNPLVAGSVLAAGATAGSVKRKGTADTAIAVSVRDVASSASPQQITVVRRDCIVFDSKLVFDITHNTAQRATGITNLNAAGIIAR